MVKMHGSSRVLDSAITETGTSAARQISLYGVTALSELTNKPLLVRSENQGVASTTIQINNLTAKSLKVMKDGAMVDTYAGWIVSNQLYFLMYNGNVFIAYPLGLVSSGGTVGLTATNISVAVMDLANAASYVTIQAAFGSANAILDFQEAIEYGTSIVTFETELTPSRRAYLIETKYDSTSHQDILMFIVEQSGNYYVVKQVYTRNTVEGASELYTSLAVTKTLISGNPAQYAPRVSVITVPANDWVLNSSTNNYEYTVNNATVTANTSVEISMDLANQALFTDGYTESSAGSYKIITSTQPSASITMTVKLQETISV